MDSELWEILGLYATLESKSLHKNAFLLQRLKKDRCDMF